MENKIEIFDNGVQVNWNDIRFIDRNKYTYKQVKIFCPQCKEWRWIDSTNLSSYRRGKRKFCGKCSKLVNKRDDIEVTSFGVKIDWSKSFQAENSSAEKNYQRKICISCLNCGKWRMVNSCSLSQVRKGKQKYCLECHKENLAKSNKSKSIGIRENYHGYIIRGPSSFNEEELSLLDSMFRKDKLERRVDILEHRSVMALYLKRPLDTKEIVHHKNGDKKDNRIENLELLTTGEHSRSHIEALSKISHLNEVIEKLKKENNFLKEKTKCQKPQ